MKEISQPHIPWPRSAQMIRGLKIDINAIGVFEKVCIFAAYSVAYLYDFRDKYI